MSRRPPHEEAVREQLREQRRPDASGPPADGGEEPRPAKSAREGPGNGDAGPQSEQTSEAGSEGEAAAPDSDAGGGEDRAHPDAEDSPSDGEGATRDGGGTPPSGRRGRPEGAEDASRADGGPPGSPKGSGAGTDSPAEPEAAADDPEGESPAEEAPADAHQSGGPQVEAPEPAAPDPVPGGEGGEDGSSPPRALERERDEYLALARRTQADFENFRKRSAREVAAAGQRARGALVRDMLPVVDNLERALSAAGDAEGSLAQGVRMVLEELNGVLARSGVESFAPAGESFDPTEHEALSVRSQQGAGPGLVLDVVSKGYRINGTVLRPARVVVSS